MEPSTNPILRYHEPLRFVFCGGCLNLIIPCQTSVHKHIAKCRSGSILPEAVDQAIAEVDASIWEPETESRPPPWEVLVLPNEIVEPIEFLTTQPAVRCNTCGTVRLSLRKWQSKCKKAHGLTSEEGEYAEVFGQCLRMGKTQRYIAVNRQIQPADLSLSLEALANLVQDAMAPEGILEDTTRLDANAFIKAARFDNHLHGFDHSDMIQALERNDVNIEGMKKHWCDLLSRIKENMAKEGDIILRQLKRRHADTDPAHTEEFHYDIQDKTLLSSYMSTMTRLIKYIYTIGEWQSEPQQKPTPCKLTALQTQAIDGAFGHDWTSEDDVLKDRGDNLLYELIESLFELRMTNSQYDSVVLSCMAVLGLDRYNRGWKDARGYGSHASAIIKISLMTIYGKAIKTVELEGKFFPCLTLLFQLRLRLFCFIACLLISIAIRISLLLLFQLRLQAQSPCYSN